MQTKKFQLCRGIALTNRFARSVLVCLMSLWGCWGHYPASAADAGSSISKRNFSEDQATGANDPILGRIKSIEFSGLSGGGLSESELLNIPVELILESTSAGDTYRAAKSDPSSVTIRLSDSLGHSFRASALQSILEAISREYQRRRIAAVRVNITRSALERLGRPDSDGILTIQIQEGAIVQVRVLTGLGSKDKAGTSPVSDPNEDRLAERIRRLSVVGQGELVNLDALDRYVAHLNRHPGRQVDVALSPGPQAGELTLDYLIAENKQPLFYGQISNTGTEHTSRCREQFGFIHHNLTRSDDILYVDYITGNFDSVHGVSGGYERPLGDGTRLRAKVFGVWREYEASEVGLAGLGFRGENYSVGGELAWNFYQRRSLFVDAVGGVQHQRVKTENDLSGTDGTSNFLLTYLGIRAEKRTETSNVSASLIGEFNTPCLVGTDDRGSNGLDRLGRDGTDRQWLTLQYALSGSCFLEPILDAKWREPDHSSTLAHELFTSLQGQVTPDDRRVPANSMQTIGGFYTVRGYPESFASGDNAFCGTLEYRYHWPRSLKSNPQVGTFFGKAFRWQPEHPLGRPDWDLILRGFFDAGYTCKNDKYSYENDLALISTGLGVELSLRNNMRLRADWGWPLRSADNGEDDVDVGECRVHLSLSVIY